MANTLTNLTPDLFAALDTVSRELVGFIPAVSRDSSAERASKDQTVRTFVTPASSAFNITPTQLQADDGDQTISNVTMTISKERYVPIRWSGREQVAMNSGPGYNPILRDQFAQAMRVLVNEVEADIAALYTNASRAAEPAGTKLFDAANYKDFASMVSILDENGAPVTNRHLVIGHTAKRALIGNAQYVGFQDAGDQTLLRQGVISNMLGLDVRASHQVKVHTPGTGTGLKTDTTGYAVGATSITVATDGSGTIVAGDVISFSGDATGSKYVVKTGGNMDSGGTVVIAEPGLRGALSVAQSNIVISTSVDRNMAFHGSAIQLATRVPSRPVEGDLAADVMVIQDPKSGLAFEIAMFLENRRIKYEVSLAWGVAAIAPRHIALLLN